MLHMKWLALHHCLSEWSSGEALGSLGQPLWFVLMFWFHNPNILRAVICSLFPFYSVILLLFFGRAKLSREKRSSFKWKSEKRQRRRETGRRMQTENSALKKNTHTQTGSASKFADSIICEVKVNMLLINAHLSTWAFWCRLRKNRLVKGSPIPTHAKSKVCFCTMIRALTGRRGPPSYGQHTATRHYRWLQPQGLKRLV